ncbi:AzlC family ABC transporter permease [Metasolibacillus meyeri]|uniref:AzlC family ABC transporter permease n=1 Tax=Metasolibacillus meyeri TaxID=1071052 RepID=A0AAW9NP66_9BACL|nr:AzlC family ABC transporter permease [Metasolibacillus meyeri]MEC1177069.1 AzlC family ABC transporter permease [Metasolibacillus meyeri]
MNSSTRAALKFAFPQTLPILAGFLFLGIAYGIFMNSLGFHAIYPILMSLLIFAGSMEFVAANLLLISFNPLSAFFLTLMVNARHLFYGISMLDKYGNLGRKKWYVIYGMCDESFAINSTLNIPNHLDKGKVMLFVTLLNQIYWVAGAAIGGIFGSFITFNTEGLEFVMTALFVVIFIENWFSTKQYHSALLGLLLSAIALAIFGGERFIIPAMLAILGILTLLRSTLQKNKEATL